ncbi:MAG: hypothetical protein ACRC1K_21630 [Planctomycetia bacterium]
MGPKTRRVADPANDCPRCGCNHSTPEAATKSLWGKARERRRCSYCGATFTVPDPAADNDD